jgi:hypothetical protein
MRIRYTVRELLLLVAIVGLSLGWWLDHLESRRQCRNAECVAWLQEKKSTRLIDAISKLGNNGALQETLDRSGFDEDLDPSLRYDDVTKLADAIAIVQSTLERDDRREYAVLLSEDRVRAAIADGIRRRDALVETEELQNPGAKAAWELARPTILSIAETGAWPKGSSFYVQYSVYNSEQHTAYEGLSVSLLGPVSLPIIEVMFRTK